MIRYITDLFKHSYGELRNVTTITITAMFAAISVVCGYFTIAIGDYIKIGFSTVANQFIYYLFGPAVGGLFGGATDIIKYIVRPTGAFFPGWTLSAIMAGIIYGFFYYKKSLGIRRILVAEFVVSLVCNVLLGTLWLHMMYGKAFILLLPPRALKNLVMWPVNSMLFYTLGKTMELTKVVKTIRGGGVISQKQ